MRMLLIHSKGRRRDDDVLGGSVLDQNVNRKGWADTENDDMGGYFLVDGESPLLCGQLVVRSWPS